jgi:large subunit ribosomal protein L17
MRHRKHSHQLGIKRAHREALMASLSTALFAHGRIQTTLAKAKALRPYAEKIITYAKKAALAEESAVKVHYRRLAVARVRDADAVKKLFGERAAEFLKRPGGYTRIYKLVQRTGDAAEMALIELVSASDEGYKKTAAARKPARKARTRRTAASADAAPAPSQTENVEPSPSPAVSA